MAGREPSISRRRILGAAASLPLAPLARQFPDSAPAAPASRALWRRRLAAYQRIAARAKDAAESGWFRAANDRYNSEAAGVVARFGSWEAAAQCEEGSRLRAAAFARVDRAEEAYWRRCTAPLQEAALALVATPAPDLPSLRTKIAVIRAHDLDEPDATPRRPIDIVDEDLARLMQL